MELKYILIIIAIVFLLLIMFGLAIVNYSSDDLWDKFQKCGKYSTGKTPVEFANLINNLHFNGSIKIKYNDNLLSDSFNSKGILTLCSKYAYENNLAGLAICAHECGHAMQYKDEPKKMKKHSRRLALSKNVSKLITPLFIAGIATLIFFNLYLGLGIIGLSVLSFFIALAAKISTLNIEKDASDRALSLLELYASFTDYDLKIAKEFLDSAKQTYLAEVLRVVLSWTMLVKKR